MCVSVDLFSFLCCCCEKPALPCVHHMDTECVLVEMTPVVLGEIKLYRLLPDYSSVPVCMCLSCSHCPLSVSFLHLSLYTETALKHKQMKII